ncbi:MAG: NADPH-dependent 7-cyano-7-deazaguanine reductase QueF [Exilibacterium sp.]
MDNKYLKTSDLPLGQQSEYVSRYTPSLLYPIARRSSRVRLGITASDTPFKGMDIWTAYEMSWLDEKGKPCVAVGEFHIPYNSPAIIESKSFKLYLNSFNQTRFNNIREVIKTLESDLSTACGGPVFVQVLPLAQALNKSLGRFPGECLDHLPVQINDYQPNSTLLSIDKPDHIVGESLYSDLLKSNCPVTGQPDWASVYIRYRGRPINREGLLKYIISFREHQDFHENCVERMFMDIQQRCAPHQLTVYARYTRRGGLDINAFRSTDENLPLDIRLVRQ